MNKVRQISIVLVGFLCLALPATAQKGKGLAKAVEATVSRQVAQQTAKKVGYSPVFGYRNFRYKVPHTRHSYITTTLKEADDVRINTLATSSAMFMVNEYQPIQVAPILDPAKGEEAFTDDYLSILASDELKSGEATQVTQALYLWRLAHPNVKDMSDIPLVDGLQKLADSDVWYNVYNPSTGDTTDYPTYLFLKYLLDPNFTPKSYAKLLKETTVYPKHIVLNEQGFPVPSAQANQARMLDIYLMQSEDMSEFYNSSQGLSAYTPFVLTKEEKQAAKQLKELRSKGDILLDNEPRHLLENIYNQLERELWPYHDPDWMVDWEEGPTFEYISYFDYAGTPAGKAIRERIHSAGDKAWEQSYDMAHLMVVDSMINNHPNTLSYYENLMQAFRKLWKETPKTTANVKHLQVLQRFVARSFRKADGFEGSEKINEYAKEVANWKIN